MVSRLAIVAAALVVPVEAAAQDTTMVQGGIFQRPFIASMGRTSVGGYAEGHGNYFVTDGIGEGWSMELRRFNIFLFSSVGRRIRFVSELEFEHGTEEIELETALLDFVINPSAVVRAGIILPPIGAFNVDHDSPRYDVVERPLVATEIIPATLSEVGFGLHGRLAPGGLTVSYDAYLTNGLGDGIILNETGRTRLAAGKGESRFEEDNNGSPAFSGRVAAHARGLGEIGLSMYSGIYNRYRIDGTVVEKKRRVSLYALDLEGNIGPIEARGEAALARIDVPESLGELFAERQWGFYLDLGMPIWRPRIRGLDRPVVSAVVRLERIDLNQGVFASTGLDRGDETSAFTVGLSFRPIAGTVFRANYRRESFRDVLGNDPVETAGFQVGFATYF